MRVKAAVLTGTGRPFEVDEVELAGPKAGEVLVKVAASGLCASDLNVIDGKRGLAPFPVVLGHEASGVVAETGPGVTRLKAGDPVLLSIVPSCGHCPSCGNGRPNYCAVAGEAMSRGGLFDGTSRLSRGGRRLNHFLTVSSFAEYAVVPESGAVRVDPAMPLDRAALISCAVLTGYGAVHNTARVRHGSRVAVFGCGGVGLNVVQGARTAGASRIVAVDVNPDKLRLAERLGATDVVHADRQDPVAAIDELTGGVDYAFEALGREQTVQQAWQSLDVGGEAVIVGLMRHGATVTLDANPFVDEKRIGGCYFGSAHLLRDVPALVERYLAGDLLLDEIISRRIGLDDLTEGFGRLRAGDGARNVLVFD
ncbi:Zn-dependent alcohol dehydrogenase [Streptomyces sp. 110]|uniref:Zn-dependent alcohol dehydrogenase n=1 Tax=Streptomyces endocoffeicus TaxID=2898945 RepID=A0ABS1Q2R3_9ACTN|nr:Zn-dependent alcohol dehydrogenase [Streptomyces endocoffeicus]MBL1118629.1 Zn-dependent alcohol dehydrogenase [Streptomyces endocoffeicus]